MSFSKSVTSTGGGGARLARFFGESLQLDEILDAFGHRSLEIRAQQSTIEVLLVCVDHRIGVDVSSCHKQRLQFDRRSSKQDTSFGGERIVESASKV